MTQLTQNQEQLSVFDYTTLADDTAKLAKESAIEIKAREKAIWENIIEIGNKLIAVKNALPYGQFGKWIDLEFQWNDRTAQKYIKIAKEIKPNPFYKTVLPNNFSALYQLASFFSDSDEETKEQILDEVKSKTQENGKPLTQTEINNLPQIIELKAKLKAEKEAKELAENNQSSLFNQLENKVKEVNKLEETIYNQIEEYLKRNL